MMGATNKLRLLLLIVVLDCGLCAQTRQPPKVKLLDSELTLTLDSSKLCYSLKENLRLTTALHNESSVTPIFVYGHLDWGGAGIGIEIEDMLGNTVETPMLIEYLPPPPPPKGDPTMLVGINLGQFFGIRLNQSARHFFPSPGRYRVRTNFFSMLEPEDVERRFRSLNIVWRGRETIFSPWITVEITP